MNNILQHQDLNASFMRIFWALNANELHRLTNGFCEMDYITRLRRNIKRDFPEITDEELAERMQIALHLISMLHKEKDKHRLPAKPLC